MLFTNLIRDLRLRMQYPLVSKSRILCQDNIIILNNVISKSSKTLLDNSGYNKEINKFN